MILAAAQITPATADVSANINLHCSMASKAAALGASFILFPEMSITAYTRENAVALSMKSDDARLDKLRQIAQTDNITIVAGAPLKMDGRVYISSLVFYPDGRQDVYTKQFLHAGEAEYFDCSFSCDPVIQLHEQRVSLAICVDINHEAHAQNASAKSTMYAASLFFTANGIDGGLETLRTNAKKFNLNVLMSNYCGRVWDLDAGGRSAFWTNSGELIVQMNTHDTGLLLVERKLGKWSGRIITDVQ